MTPTTEYLWQTYGTEVYLYVLKKTSDSSVAEDLRQNTFLKAHQNLSAVKDVSKAKSWLFTIARNELMDYFQRVRKQKSVPSSSTPEIDHSTINENPCCFDRFMSSLPSGQREAVHLVYSKGYSQKEAASSLNIPLSALKSRLRKAKESLKELFVSCCKYELSSNGILKGEGDCKSCKAK